MSPFGTTTTHTSKLLPSPAAATASLLHLAGFRARETAGLAIATVRSPACAFWHTDFAMPVLGIQIIHTYRTSTQGRLSGGLSATRSATRKRAPPNLPLSSFTPAAAIHAHIAMVTAAAVDSVIGLEASRGGFGGINQHRLGGGGGASETLISLTPPVLREGRCKDFPACHHGETDIPFSSGICSHTSVHTA